MNKNTKIVLVFLKNKVKEIGVAILNFLIAVGIVVLLIAGIGCILFLIGLVTSSIIPSSVLSSIKTSTICPFIETRCFVGFCIGIFFAIGYGIFRFVKWFIDWIKDNWKEAIREVERSERNKQ